MPRMRAAVVKEAAAATRVSFVVCELRIEGEAESRSSREDILIVLVSKGSVATVVVVLGFLFLWVSLAGEFL